MATQRNAPEATNTLDWGSPNSISLPSSLRNLWKHEVLPDWACMELGIPPRSSIDGLPIRPSSGLSLRLRNYLAFLVESRRESIKDVRILDKLWPLTLKVEQIPWRPRTRTALAKAGILDPPTQLPSLTFGVVLDVAGMGAQSILDFACSLELAVDLVAKETLVLPSTDEERNPSAILLAALEEPWADSVSERDPRFADLLPPGRGTLTERIDQLTSSAELSVTAVDRLATSIDQIRVRISQLAGMPLEAQLQELLSAVARVQDERRSEALKARFQWHGAEHRATLDEAGALAGVTRQRIQQLESRTLERWPQHPIVMPGVDRALTVLASQAPLSPEAASRLLQTSGISHGQFHPASLIAVAQDCGRQPIVQLEEVLGSTMLVASAATPLAGEIVQTAYSQARARGATNVEQVANDVNVRHGVDLSLVQVSETLRLYGKVEFLVGDWMWNPAYLKDTVRNISRRMLSVTAPLDVSHLREGMKRVFRFRAMSAARNPRYSAPPREVLLAYYRAHPEFVVLESGKVRPLAPLDYRTELGDIEQVLVSVLRSSPASVLDRVTFGEECIERGVNPNSLWTVATYSPVIERLGFGLWTLTGTQLDPAAVESVRAAAAVRPREKRIEDFGWNADGTLWVAIRVPAAAAAKVFGLPSAVARYLEGRDFQALSGDGRMCGIIRIYDGAHSGGYGRFLALSGADEGDILLTTFDMATNTVVLNIIDDEDLEALSPAL